MHTFLNGAVGIRLPSLDSWVDEYERDLDTKLMQAMLSNPSLITKKVIEALHYVYRGPMRRNQIKISDGMLSLHKQVRNESAIIKLTIVPRGLWNIIFIALHANPIGGHLGPALPLHRIRLRYHWPHQYKYITDLCAKCAGCSLSNSFHHPTSELIYSFPFECPFMVVFMDIYHVGAHESFTGDKYILLATDAMTAFTIYEPLPKVNANLLDGAMMKILLNEGI